MEYSLLFDTAVAPKDPSHDLETCPSGPTVGYCGEDTGK